MLFSFVESMKPTIRAYANLPRIDISGLGSGEFRILTHSTFGELYNGYTWSVFLYRKKDGDIKAWDIPTKSGAVGMPDIHWLRPIYLCKSFGPTLTRHIVDEK